MGGFVVVAPLFPDEEREQDQLLVPRTVTQSELAESDVVNEPYDIAYVTGGSICCQRCASSVPRG